MKNNSKKPCPKCKEPLFYTRKGDNWEYPMICPDCQNSKKRIRPNKWNHEQRKQENTPEKTKTLVKTRNLINSSNDTNNRI